MDWLHQLSRLPGFRGAWLRLDIGSIPNRFRFDIWERAAYGFGLYSAAEQAKALGLQQITAIEFGVAGGTGLVVMERLAARIGNYFGITINVAGFDLGEGLPDTSDFRDLPHVWQKGCYQMDQEALRKRLTNAQLILGNVADTVPHFVSALSESPVGFISFDLDYYSSTTEAFRIFSGPHHKHLPRVICYFDDMIWPEAAYHNEFVGELAAIKDFNANHSEMKICPIANLQWAREHPAYWNAEMFVCHDFAHPQYEVCMWPKGEEKRQLPLTA